MQDVILEQYQVRKSNKQKAEFIQYLKERLSQSGYDTEKDIIIETRWKSIFKTRNIVVGNPEEAEVVVTAHYDTCAVLPFPNFMAPTNPVLFVMAQILIALLIFFLTGVVAFLFALLTNNFFEAGNVFLVVLFLILYYVMFGYRNKHTANDNTSGVVAITQLLENLPIEHRKKLCVVYFDNEEKGLFGSAFFAKKHKKSMKNKMLINLDCVGDGENIVFMAKRKARKDKKYPLFVDALTECAKDFEGQYFCKKMKPLMFGSDQANFNNAMGVCALKKSFFGMYCGRIHTPWDTVCRAENIHFLTCVLKTFIEKI